MPGVDFDVLERGGQHGTSLEPTELPADRPIGKPRARPVSRSRLSFVINAAAVADNARGTDLMPETGDGP